MIALHCVIHTYTLALCWWADVVLLSVWVVWARWRREGLTPGMPKGKRSTDEEKTRDEGEIDICPPDVLLGIERWFMKQPGGNEKAFGHGAQ